MELNLAGACGEQRRTEDGAIWCHDLGIIYTHERNGAVFYRTTHDYWERSRYFPNETFRDLCRFAYENQYLKWQKNPKDFKDIMYEYNRLYLNSQQTTAFSILEEISKSLDYGTIGFELFAHPLIQLVIDKKEQYLRITTNDTHIVIVHTFNRIGGEHITTITFELSDPKCFENAISYINAFVKQLHTSPQNHT